MVGPIIFVNGHGVLYSLSFLTLWVAVTRCDIHCNLLQYFGHPAKLISVLEKKLHRGSLSKVPPNNILA